MRIENLASLMYTFTDTDKKLRENSFNSSTNRTSFRTRSSSVDGAQISDMLAGGPVSSDLDVSFTAVQGRMKDLFGNEDFQMMARMAEIEAEIAGV